MAKFQHLYNATQALLKKRDANCAYYYGLGYVAPQLRGRLTHDILKDYSSFLPAVDTRISLNTMQVLYVLYMKSTNHLDLVQLENRANISIFRTWRV